MKVHERHFPGTPDPRSWSAPMPVAIPDLSTDVLTIRPWPDEVIDALGHDPRSAYVERFWLGVLGPSAIWLLRRLGAGLDAPPPRFALPRPPPPPRRFRPPARRHRAGDRDRRLGPELVLRPHARPRVPVRPGAHRAA